MADESKIEPKIESKTDIDTSLITLKKQTDVNTIMNLFNECHNILWEAGKYQAPQIFPDMIRLLFIRFIHPHLSGRLNTLMDPTKYPDSPRFKADNLKYLDYHNLISTHGDSGDFGRAIEFTWDLLSSHDYTKEIYPAQKNPKFFCNMTKLHECFNLIVQKLDGIDFDNLPVDIKGGMYENFVNGYFKNATDSQTGQYFTPRNYVKLIVSIVKHINGDQIPSSVLDPTCGSGGFLTEAFKSMHINPENIYGCEVEIVAYTNALMNLLLTTGIPCQIKYQNTFIDPVDKKFKIILSNPPFSCPIKYEEMINLPENKDKDLSPIYPVKIDDGIALILQNIVYRLEDNGICAIILPEGKCIDNLGADYIALRKYICDNCSLLYILDVRSGIFKHTTAKTVTLFFVKGKQTTRTQFLKASPELDRVEITGEADYKMLESKNFIFDYARYMNRDVNSVHPTKTINEICEFISRGKLRNSKEGKSEGKYPLYYCTIKNNLYMDTYDYDCEEILINRTNGSGKCKIFYANGKHCVAKSVLRFKSKDPNVYTAYIYYYLSNKIQIVETAYKGVNQKGIKLDIFGEIKIPIPPLEKQREMIMKCMQYDQYIEQLDRSKKEALAAIKTTITTYSRGD